MLIQTSVSQEEIITYKDVTSYTLHLSEDELRLIRKLLGYCSAIGKEYTKVDEYQIWKQMSALLPTVDDSYKLSVSTHSNDPTNFTISAVKE